MLSGTALHMGTNWFVYIYDVNTNQIVETSLGYFINPLLNVLMGFLFLCERLNSWQSLALIMATLGVLNFLWKNSVHIPRSLFRWHLPFLFTVFYAK